MLIFLNYIEKNKENLIVTVHNLGDKMMIQGLYLINGRMNRAKTWYIDLKNSVGPIKNEPTKPKQLFN